MTLARKERIEQIATTLLAALAPTLGNSDIAWAEARRNVAIQAKFLSEQIDALPATEPDDEVSQAKRILGVRPDAPLVGSLLNFVHQRTKDAMLAREANRAKAPSRVPDTTTPLRNGDKVKVIGLSRDGSGRYQWQIGTYEWVVKFGGCAVSFAGGVGSIYPRASLDGPLNRQPDHIAEINKLVDAVFGKPDNAQ